MFGLLGLFRSREKIANPVGLDSALYWLTLKVDEDERRLCADRVGGCLVLGLTMLKIQGTTAHQLSRQYYEAQAEALKKHEHGVGSMSDAAVAYMVMSFFIVIQHLDTENGKTNFSKIFSYIDAFANESIKSKLLEFRGL